MERALNKCVVAMLGLLLACWGTVVRAGLPTVADPSSGAVTEGDFIGMLQAYALDIVVLGGLLVSAVALMIVAKNVIAKYSMVADGKATWGEVGMHGGVGVVLLVIVVYLVTQASGVLA